jgi:transposase/FtsZ-binding cell division protein ZapB
LTEVELSASLAHVDIAMLAEEIDSLREHVQLLTASHSELRQQNERLASERERYRELYLQLLEQCKRLERGLLAGPKAERLSLEDTQLTLAILGALLERKAPSEGEPTEAPAGPPAASPRAKPTGRKPLPEHLPKVVIEIVPDEVQREGLDAFERIGEEVSETVEKRPASLVCVHLVRPKFVRKDRERLSATSVRIAEVPELPIERGVAGPALLADTIVRRWADHLPLHRLEGIYAREGLALARSTLCGWHDQLRPLVDPLVEAMWEDAKTAPYLCTDATGVLVQAKQRCRRGHFFVVVAPERHVLFRYTPTHDKKAVDRMLAGYQGYLVADAHAVYDHLYAGGQVIEVGCWSHCRRYFFESLSTDPERARTALAYLQGLFQIERRIAECSRHERSTVRHRESRPLVEGFFAWCEAQAASVLDDTPIAKGIRYARNQRQALERFLEDARLPIHNNVSERELRREAVGRKNWLFVGSDQGAEVNATFVSLLASCQMHGLEPWSYLRDLFCLLPRWPKRRVLELAPTSWQQTLEREDTQQRLAANVYRKVALGEIG